MSELDAVTVIKFPTVEDMSINGKVVIDELQKMIDEVEGELEGQSIVFGLKVAMTTVKELQEKAYQDFLAACKITQV